MRALPAYLFLYSVLYGGWGVLSPFLPAVLAERGATPEAIGLLLAGGIAARLVSMPAAGLLADRSGAPRLVLALLLVAGAAFGLGYGLVPAGSAGLLLLVGLAQHAATGPLGPLPDALAVRAAAAAAGDGRGGRARFDYGVVRGAGAAAFIAGAALAGSAVEAAGSAAVVLWLNAGLFALAAGAVLLLPRPPFDAVPPSRGCSGEAGSVRDGKVAGAARHPGVPPPAAGVRPHLGQPRLLHRLRHLALAGGGAHGRGDRAAVVGVRRLGGGGVLPPRPAAARAARAGRALRAGRGGGRAALGGDGRYGVLAGDAPGAAAARADLRGAAPGGDGGARAGGARVGSRRRVSRPTPFSARGSRRRR